MMPSALAMSSTVAGRAVGHTLAVLTSSNVMSSRRACKIRSSTTSFMVMGFMVYSSTACVPAARAKSSIARVSALRAR